jgi:hypothetical protein
VKTERRRSASAPASAKSATRRGGAAAAAAAVLAGVDLSLLAARVWPDAALAEPDVVWDPAALLRDAGGGEPDAEEPQS